MATLAEMLRQTGYAKDGQLQAPAPTQPNLSTMAGDYIRQLPAKTAQNAIDMNYMVQNAMPYNPQTHQFETGPTFSEFANYVPNLMGSTNAIKTAKALLSAEKQAALPVSEGGLGLAKNNTPAERAAAQGYIDYYHGTERLDRLLEGKTLDPKRATSGPMPYGTASNQMASNYATGKKDTSRIANDMGEMANYFQVSPKDLGYTRQKTPYTVEQTWHHLSPEKKAEILDKAQRVGFENLDEYSGNFIIHPEGVKGMPVGEDTWNYYLNRESQGNPLTALKKIWAESGNLGAYDQSKLADIYKLAGYPHEISQANAPWASAEGVLLGKARITNPIHTNNIEEIQNNIIPALKEAFKNDRSRSKSSGGADQWDKNIRYTPKEWVNTLEQDLINGVGTPIPEQSYVWTSIPDKVTAELKKLGYNGIIDTGGKMGGQGHQVVIPFDPSQVRSRFAAFNPKDVNKPDLLAGAIAVPMADEDTRKATLEKLFNEQK